MKRFLSFAATVTFLSIPIPASYASSVSATQPVFGVDAQGLTSGSPTTWGGGASSAGNFLYACVNPVQKHEDPNSGAFNSYAMPGSGPQAPGCLWLSADSSGNASLAIGANLSAGYVQISGAFTAFDATQLAARPHFVFRSMGQANGQPLDVWTDSIQLGGFYSGSGGSGSSSVDSSPPAKYSGPEFSRLSAKGIMSGSASRLEGKNLDEISSITIHGKRATFKLDGDKALDLTLPEGLAPGLYDLVINSSAGKLTHINAIQVREPKRSFSITTRSVGKISNDQYLEHSLIAGMQIPELDKARCIVNASSLTMAKMMADRLCAIVKASNPNIETTVVVPRSTVSGDTVFARVTYGWN